MDFPGSDSRPGEGVPGRGREYAETDNLVDNYQERDEVEEEDIVQAQ